MTKGLAVKQYSICVNIHDLKNGIKVLTQLKVIYHY